MTEALKLAGLKERALQEGDTAMPDPFVVLSLLSRLADSVSSNLKNSTYTDSFPGKASQKQMLHARNSIKFQMPSADKSKVLHKKKKKKKGRGLVAPESYAFL